MPSHRTRRSATAVRNLAAASFEAAHSNVVRLSGRRRAPAKSQYELYPLPFFDGKNLSTWAVQSSGDYSKDYATGFAYALEFLASRDGTVGWSSLLAPIVSDMIRAGATGTFANGKPKVNGIVIGFMSAIGNALNADFA